MSGEIVPADAAVTFARKASRVGEADSTSRPSCHHTQAHARPLFLIVDCQDRPARLGGGGFSVMVSDILCYRRSRSLFLFLLFQEQGTAIKRLPQKDILPSDTIGTERKK